MSGVNQSGDTQITLNAEEKRVYGQLFKQCDPEQLGIVTGEVARTLFERTGLAPNVLGEIWQMADVENQGFLNQIGFSLALRLIGQVQGGQKLTPQLGNYPGPMPKFDSPQRPTSMHSTGNNSNNNNNNNNNQGIVSPAPISAAAASGTPASPGSRVPPLNTADRARFIGLFDKSAPNGVLDGDQARNIFLKARLPNETLGQIWSLSDAEGKGSLNQTEFVVAMHLIQCTINHSLRSLPDALPPVLWEAAATGRSSARDSPRAANSGRNNSVQQQQQLPRQFTGGSVASGQRQPIGPASADWQINPKERQRFDAIFSQLDQQKRGVIGGSEVVPFLTTSKLDSDTLAQVWDLADVHNTGEFTKNEFAIAMYLVQQKIAGRELPSVLPQSLLADDNDAWSRQGSVSSPPPLPPQQPLSAQQVNPVFFPMDQAPAQPPSQPPSQQRGTNNSSMNDLADLNDLFSSPAPAQTGFDSPKPEQPKQFVPTSSFGQSLTQTQSPQVTGQQQSPAPAPASAPANRDLLAENDETAQKLSSATTEFGNLSNQISSLTTQTVGLTEKREKSEQELANILSKKQDIETKLTALRANYDQEVGKVREVEQQLDQAKQELTKLTKDHSLLEASQSALAAQYEKSSSALAATRQENATLKEKITASNEEIAQLKEKLENVEKEAKQQRNMAPINQKQLESNEQEQAKLESDIEAASAASAASASASASASVASLPEKSRQNSQNPFFSGNFAATPPPQAAAPQPPQPESDFDTAARQREFEETFGRMEVASPSTVEPARSSTQNTADTPNTSPPASDFQYNNQDTNQNNFTLPLARPESATSSVQNNPPQSVRGELDVSRPESPDETSAPVTGIVPPEDFPEIEGAKAQDNAHSEAMRQASHATLTPDEEVKSDRHSSESFEMVNADDSSSSSPATEEKKAIQIPGGFPEQETSTKDWEENQKFNQDFPPINEVEKFDSDSSSDDEGPEDLVKNRPDFEPEGSTQATLGDDEPSSMDEGHFTSAPSSPEHKAATTTAAVAPIDPPSYDDIKASTPKPEQSANTFAVSDDPFANAFNGLSEAKEDEGTEEFQFDNSSNFDTSFQSTFATAPIGQEPPSLAPPARTANDEWEQLFAGFNNNNNSAGNGASQQEVNDAFQVKPEENVAMTPHSAAVEHLVGMGFSKADAKDALEKKSYNLEEATNYLLDK